MSDSDSLLRDAIALHQAGQFAAAGALYARILAATPAHAEALHLSGLIAYKEGRLDDALARVAQAIRQVPGNAVYLGNLGNILKDAGRRDDAMDAYRRALALDPAHVSARNNLGVLLKEGGDAAQAIEEFRRVIAQKPDHFRAHYNLGGALIQAGDLAAAEAPLRRALALQPAFADALGDLGLLLLSLGRAADAIGVFRQRVALEPRSGPTHADLALALQRDGRLTDAVASYERAIPLAPDALGVICNFCALLQKTCDWERLAQQLPHVMRALEEGRPGVPVGLTTSLPGVTPAQQLNAARANASALGRREQLPTSRIVDPSSRLRIGYLSADFREHATAYLVSELFELHDRARHEIFLFSHGPDDGSAARARLRAAADDFVDIAAVADAVVARRIAAAGIDILVDLNGDTDNGRMGVAAFRPAPIQVNWLGFPGTLGADWYDYLIADPYVIPSGREADYAEAVVRLPDCYQCNDRRRPRPQAAVPREAFGLPSEGVVLCSFNQAFKITPAIFAIWMRVLAATPRAMLWLYDDNPVAVASLRRAALDLGVAPERLHFAPHADHLTHLSRYGAADLAVDTFPCTSHTTGSDALWMGCPLVTITGETFAARVATSLLANVGLADLAADSPAAYESLLLDLAADPARCGAVRRRLEARLAAAPLFDTPRWVGNIERAYARMAAMAATGQPPRGFDLR